MAARLRKVAAGAKKGTACGKMGDAGRDAAAARARSFRRALAPVLAAIAVETGGTPEGIAASLTRRGVRKPRGGRVWTPPDVRRLLSRLATESESREAAS